MNTDLENIVKLSEYNRLQINAHKTQYLQKKLLVQSLILPSIDYCNAVYSDLTSDLSAKFQRLQNMCLRYIGLYNLKSWEHISSYYEILEWLAQATFQPLDVNHKHHTRSCETSQLIIPYYKSNFFSQSFT
ncbi:hypothetical protein PR048_018055, partial [Dryococelus australis]